jgi:acetyl-CoA C-acetyltransferase
VSEGLRKILLDLNRAKTMPDRVKIATKIRPKHLLPLLPANSEPRTGLSMGDHCELTAKVWQIPRDEQDALAFNSHKNMAAAYERGFFKDMITPFKGLERDNNLRGDSTLEKLASLKPCYDKKGGTLTAANSTPP